MSYLAGKCEKEGYLRKLGGKVVKTWQQRYFFYRDNQLSWAKSPQDAEVIKTIRVDKCSVSNAEKPTGRKFAFGLHVPSMKPYYLAAKNEEEMLAWMQILQPPMAFSEKVTIEDFDLLSVIGKGSFGKVMQVRKKDTGTVYALKTLRKDAILARNQERNAMSERRILQKVDHPFLVGLKFAFQSDDKLYMVLDFISGGELFHHLQKQRRFSEARVKLYAAEIILGLGHLHAMDIVYRDLKPENILLTSDGHIALTDFGLCKEDMTDDTTTNTFCGSPEYLAPEILKNQGYGKAVDWWSLGTLVYEMLVGLPPFYSQNVNIMYERILKSDLKFPPHVSKEARQLIKGLLERDPSRRLGAGPTDAEEIKKEPFFAGFEWEKCLAKGYDPEFKPSVKGDSDLSHFDDTFTSEKPIDSVVESKLTDTKNFDSFTFVSSNLDAK